MATAMTALAVCPLAFALAPHLVPHLAPDQAGPPSAADEALD
jgi:hypothetical protein